MAEKGVAGGCVEESSSSFLTLMKEEGGMEPEVDQIRPGNREGM